MNSLNNLTRCLLKLNDFKPLLTFIIAIQKLEIKFIDFDFLLPLIFFKIQV